MAASRKAPGPLEARKGRISEKPKIRDKFRTNFTTPHLKTTFSRLEWETHTRLWYIFVSHTGIPVYKCLPTGICLPDRNTCVYICLSPRYTRSYMSPRHKYEAPNLVVVEGSCGQGVLADAGEDEVAHDYQPALALRISAMFHTCGSVWCYIYLSICLFVYLCIYLSLYIYVYPSIHEYI